MLSQPTGRSSLQNARFESIDIQVQRFEIKMVRNLGIDQNVFSSIIVENNWTVLQFSQTNLIELNLSLFLHQPVPDASFAG